MVDLLKSLKNKPEPLAKKTDVTPALPNIAEAMNATPKQAQMAPTPQAQQGRNKRLAQQSQRSAQVQAQAPQKDPEAETTADTAQKMITDLSNVLAAEYDATQVLDPNAQNVTGATGEELLSTAVTEDLTEEDFKEKAKDGVDDFLSSPVFTDAMNVTMQDLTEAGDYPEIVEYATQLGLGADATLNDIKQRVDEEIAQTTQIVDNQREILNDPNATPLERKEASRNMMDYGAAHLLASEAELDQFGQDIQSIGVIEIDGVSTTLEELQDNEAVMGTLASSAKALLEDPEHEPTWAKGQPQLWDFIKNNSSAIISTFWSDDPDNKSEWQRYEKIEETVNDNAQLIEQMGPEMTQRLNLGTPSSTSITETYPRLEILDPKDSAKILAETGHEQDAIKSAIKYVSNTEEGKEFVKTWLRGDSTLSVEGFMERMSDLQAIDKFNYKGVAGVHGSRIKEVLEDLKTNGQKYSDEDKEVLEYYNDPNLQEKMKKDILAGKPIPQLSGVKTVPERQKGVVDNITRDVDFAPKTPKDVRNSIRSANKALDKLLGIKNPPQFVLDEIKKLRDFKKKYAPSIKYSDGFVGSVEGSKSDKEFETEPTWSTLKSEPIEEEIVSPRKPSGFITR